jgi:hypothetical protein
MTSGERPGYFDGRTGGAVPRLALAVIVVCLTGTVAIGGPAGAEPRPSVTAGPHSVAAGGHGGGPGIQNGSEWTFQNPNSDTLECEVLSFQTDPDDFSGDLGDSGVWTGRKSSLTLKFQRGPGPSAGFSPGLFHGHLVHNSSGDYGGEFHYKVKVFHDKMTAELSPETVAGC